MLDPSQLLMSEIHLPKPPVTREPDMQIMKMQYTCDKKKNLTHRQADRQELLIGV